MRLAVPVLAALLLVSPHARGAIGDNDVGINTHIPADPVIDLCVELGLTWIRVDNNWLDAGDPCGSPDAFAPLDDSVSYAVAAGLEVYMTLGYTPPCASTGDSDGRPHNDVPDAGEWEDYVLAAVAHYRAMGVRAFGLWNEVNLDGFWEAPPPSTST